MKPADKAIKDVLARFGEEWTEATVWRVQGTAVISHKTLERIAQRAGIAFDPPTIIRAERDEAVILVTGHRIDQSAWSIGEARINQNYRVSGKQAAYPWAMAEKRAKDRVILKLIELHGMAYSEDEADDFKNGERQTAVDDDTDARSVSERMRDEMAEALSRRAGSEAVDRFMQHPNVRRDLATMDPADVKAVQAAADARRAVEPARFAA